jgi:hypothetical protein
MSGEIRRHNINREMAHKCVSRCALVFLAITFVGLSTHVGSAQTPDFECAQLSNVPDDGSPLAVGLKVLASQKIDPSQAESACRSALKADPTNPIFMFLLGRALSLGSKRLEAIKYYLDAADRGHAGAMNDLACVCCGVATDRATNNLFKSLNGLSGKQKWPGREQQFRRSDSISMSEKFCRYK